MPPGADSNQGLRNTMVQAGYTTKRSSGCYLHLCVDLIWDQAPQQ